MFCIHCYSSSLQKRKKRKEKGNNKLEIHKVHKFSS